MTAAVLSVSATDAGVRPCRPGPGGQPVADAVSIEGGVAGGN